jgi:four helix bundle protein
VPDGKIASYQDLKVWQSAMELAVKSYGLTKAFPKDEMFGLTSQIRRAAVSIAANIAEGYGRENRGSFVQFLRIAQGSLKELETHILIAKRVGLVTGDGAANLLAASEENGKMLRSLIRVVQRKQANE